MIGVGHVQGISVIVISLYSVYVIQHTYVPWASKFFSTLYYEILNHVKSRVN